MARHYGSWYNDRAINAIDARLALGAAGAGAKAFGALAKIPLDIDDRDMADREIRVDEDKNKMAKYVSDQRLKGAKVSANGKIVAASLGLKGRKAAAYARMYDANMSRKNNINTNNTAKDGYEYAIIKETIKGANAKDVAKINKSAKSPTQEEYFYDRDGNKIKKVNRAYAPPVDFTYDALDEVAKTATRKKKL